MNYHISPQVTELIEGKSRGLLSAGQHYVTPGTWQALERRRREREREKKKGKNKRMERRKQGERK